MQVHAGCVSRNPALDIQYVHVKLDIDSGTWSMERKDIRDAFVDMFKERNNVSVGIGNYYKSVRLIFFKQPAHEKMSDGLKEFLGWK